MTPRRQPAAVPCAFCDIVAGRRPATVVHRDARTLAFMDRRQFHPGHVLVVPRRHVPDLRHADAATAAAVMQTAAKLARAVDRAFPNEGMTLWHSIGPAGGQEVPHLHVHVHPRRLDDGFLRVYPSSPRRPRRAILEQWGARVRAALDEE